MALVIDEEVATNGSEVDRQSSGNRQLFGVIQQERLLLISMS